jgi:hypothetical protein
MSRGVPPPLRGTGARCTPAACPQHVGPQVASQVVTAPSTHHAHFAPPAREHHVQPSRIAQPRAHARVPRPRPVLAAHLVLISCRRAWSVLLFLLQIFLSLLIFLILFEVLTGAAFAATAGRRRRRLCRRRAVSAAAVRSPPSPPPSTTAPPSLRRRAHRLPTSHRQPRRLDADRAADRAANRTVDRAVAASAVAPSPPPPRHHHHPPLPPSTALPTTRPAAR